ncbi:MAG: DUF4124 domain-containing protein [Pseudomonas sp.]
MPHLRLALLLPLLCTALAAQAQVYTWVDADGQKHFGSMPPTPEQAVQPVEIRASSLGNAQPAPTPEATPTSEALAAPSPSPQASQSEHAAQTPTRKMCSEAVRWTGIDLPNLKEIALERRRQGKINQSQYQQAMKALDQVKAEVTVPNCLASRDKDQRQYECLAQGLGIAVCSGALSEALNKL